MTQWEEGQFDYPNDNTRYWARLKFSAWFYLEVRGHGGEWVGSLMNARGSGVYELVGWEWENKAGLQAAKQDIVRHYHQWLDEMKRAAK